MDMGRLTLDSRTSESIDLRSRVPQEKVKWEIIHHKNFKNSRLWLTLQVSDVFSQYIMRQLPYRTCYKRLYRCKHTQTKPLLCDRNASGGRSHQHVSFAILVSRLFWGFFGSLFLFVCFVGCSFSFCFFIRNMYFYCQSCLEVLF